MLKEKVKLSEEDLELGQALDVDDVFVNNKKDVNEIKVIINDNKKIIL